MHFLSPVPTCPISLFVTLTTPLFFRKRLDFTQKGPVGVLEVGGQVSLHLSEPLKLSVSPVRSTPAMTASSWLTKPTGERAPPTQTLSDPPSSPLCPSPKFQFVTEALESLKQRLEAWVHPIRAQGEVLSQNVRDI